MDNKKELRINSFKQQFLFGEGISFLMGCSKNYIMYWGVYEYYNTTTLPKSVHKFHKFSSILLGTLYK